MDNIFIHTIYYWAKAHLIKEYFLAPALRLGLGNIEHNWPGFSPEYKNHFKTINSPCRATIKPFDSTSLISVEPSFNSGLV
jgi:hypothetical protein